MALLIGTGLADEHYGARAPRMLLEHIYAAHHQPALGLACRILRNQQDAEEAVQEVFLSVWRMAATYDLARGSTRTWVLGAVRNRAIDMIRARKRRPQLDCLDSEVHDTECDVVATAVASLDRERVLQVLADLPPSQCQAVEMAFFGGFSHTEIADLLNLPVGTVKSRIRLGLDQLRRAMGGEERRPLNPHHDDHPVVEARQ